MRIGKVIQAIYENVKTGKDPHLIVLKPGKPRYPLPKRERQIDLIDPALRQVIRDLVFGKLPWPLYLHGEAGSGKTCAVQCMVEQFGGWYNTLPELSFDLRQAMLGKLQTSSGFQRTEYEIWRDWETTNLVILDEIAAKNLTPHQYETLKHAIDLRHEKPAGFISNQNLQGIDRLYDDRIASRLGEGTVCELTGDRRNRKDVRDGT